MPRQVDSPGGDEGQQGFSSKFLNGQKNSHFTTTTAILWFHDYEAAWI